MTIATSHAPFRNEFQSAPTGYFHPQYAESLAEYGTPRHLSASGGWLLIRDIPATAYQDAMSPYPLLCCRDWRLLADDLRELGSDVVSVTVVADPAGDYRESDLTKAFDRVSPFKSHFMLDTEPLWERTISKNHKIHARRALRDVQVDLIERPLDFLDEWVSLYSTLTRRHGITGIRAFSRQAFAAQLAVPGMTMFRATHNGEPVGMDLWYLQGDVAQSHLLAFSELGYQLHASYAARWISLQYFADKVRYINMGGAAGPDSEGSANGLARFKKGWSNMTRMAYLCGKVMDPPAYANLAKQAVDSSFFPAYRAGEYG
ncbi:MAG: GNAT family N-acetyltransferase [Pseudomonadales bacterium]